MLRKRTTVIYSPKGLNAEQKAFIDGHNGKPGEVCFDFAERFIGCEVTRKLVRQFRKRQQQQAVA
jgi:hypothetical protein